MNEQALKERIKYIANTEDRLFNQVWRDLVLERLLVRLSRSPHNNQFIFKGGLLLAHYIELGRETKDVDFLATQLDANASEIKKAFQEICQAKVEDGFTYSFSRIEQLDQEQMNYPGYRVNLDLKFSRMKDLIQVDIGVGDIVAPKQESFELYQYKGKPIFEGSVSLKVYPVETIFAEKLESIIARGAANSRMKDYHDLLLLCREEGIITAVKLKEDIEKTFGSRNTDRSLPIQFTVDEFGRLQTLWAAHRNGLQKIADEFNLPANIEDVVREINTWLSKNQISL
jgi:predicted nucleotidyltransferase component of viral defense system